MLPQQMPHKRVKFYWRILDEIGGKINKKPALRRVIYTTLDTIR